MDEEDQNPTPKAQSTILTPEQQITECPNTKESLGFYTWNFLHTMGAYYPENPNQKTQTDMKKFLELFGQFYPCKTCAGHYNQDIKLNPPKTDSRKNLSVWLCLQHNNVNRL